MQNTGSIGKAICRKFRRLQKAKKNFQNKPFLKIHSEYRFTRNTKYVYPNID